MAPLGGRLVCICSAVRGEAAVIISGCLGNELVVGLFNKLAESGVKSDSCSMERSGSCLIVTLGSRWRVSPNEIGLSLLSQTVVTVVLAGNWAVGGGFVCGGS